MIAAAPLAPAHRHPGERRDPYKAAGVAYVAWIQLPLG